jgi:hypothetical protein
MEKTYMLDSVTSHSGLSRRRQSQTRRRQRASARRHFRQGCRAAATRAFTAAELYLGGKVATLAAAAMHCGSNVQYIQAAIVVRQDETASSPQKIQQSILEGHVPLLAAARKARRRQEAARVTVEKMVATYRGWTPAQRANFGRTVGVAELWDDSIVPAIGGGHGETAYAVAAE